MKKLVITLIAACLSLLVWAQEPEESSETTKDYTQIAQAGISLGYYGYGYSGTRTGFSLPLSVAYERYIKENISVGAFVGFVRYGYDYTYLNTTYKYSWTFFDVGGRASYHYLDLLNEIAELSIDTDKYDFYVSLLLGLEFRSYSSNDEFDIDYENQTEFIGGGIAGFRYHLSDQFSVFAEGGRGLFGYGTFGVSYRF